MTTEQPDSCNCGCHDGLSVSVRDAIEAITACPLCRNVHCPAFLGDLDKPLDLPDKNAPYDPMEDGN